MQGKLYADSMTNIEHRVNFKNERQKEKERERDHERETKRETEKKKRD